MPSDALLNDLSQLVTNELPTRLPKTVAFIVGSNPSQGARSPKLWNAAFKACDIDGEMYPLDVAHKHLAIVLRVLEDDPRVVGVAVAAPYKGDFAAMLHPRLTPSALRCMSINVMTRDDSGLFLGANTDGLAAVESLRELEPRFAESRILILGCGGTGRAVIASLLSEVRPENLLVAVRSDGHRDWLSALGVRAVSMTLEGVNLEKLGVVINCTTIGWGAQSEESPLTATQLSQLARGCVIFDVVYQPDPSVLLRSAKARDLRTLSGSRMNLLQAAIAFASANRIADHEIVSVAVAKAAR